MDSAWSIEFGTQLVVVIKDWLVLFCHFLTLQFVLDNNQNSNSNQCLQSLISHKANSKSQQRRENSNFKSPKKTLKVSTTEIPDEVRILSGNGFHSVDASNTKLQSHCWTDLWSMNRWTKLWNHKRFTNTSTPPSAVLGDKRRKVYIRCMNTEFVPAFFCIIFLIKTSLF